MAYQMKGNFDPNPNVLITNDNLLTLGTLGPEMELNISSKL